MKKHAFLILTFFFFVPIYSYAQPSLGFSMAFGNPYFEKIKGLSFSAGLITEYPLATHVDLRSGLQYSRRKVGAGFMYEGPVWDLNAYFVPLVFKFKMPINKFELYANAGGSFGLIANPEHKIVDAAGESPIRNVSFKRQEYGLILGAGVNLKIKKCLLFFEINHRQSLNDLTDLSDEYDLRINTAELINVGLLVPVRPLE